MFYEYALDPEVLSDVSRCSTFFESFNGRASRLISDVPKKWQQKAFLAIDGLPHDKCPPVKKKKLKEYLKKIVRTNLIKSRNSHFMDSSVSWEQFVAQEHSIYPFSGLLGVCEVLDPVHVYSLETLAFDHPAFWDSQEQRHVSRIASEIVGTMLPLIGLSKKIHLVDPYFLFTRPTWDHYAPVLKLIVSHLGEGNYGQGITTLHIHTSDDRGSMEPQLKHQLEGWLPPDVRVKVSHWPKNSMHDRFLLTDVGGLHFSYGLAEASDGKLDSVLVSVLDKATYLTELAKLNAQPTIQYEYMQDQIGKPAV